MQQEHGPVETWERRPGAAVAPIAGYRRREPEKTLLHAIVRERLEPFLAAARDRSASGRGLPAHVERDLRAYLDCGILARGFARIRCPDCGFERLVAFSCKARSCPSCNARRMEDAADHLVHDVFPEVPVRQWVLSFPRRLRFLAARDPRVASRLLDLLTPALFAWQRRAARRLGVADPRTAGVTAIQRFGGAINLNVHFHTLVPDGVFDLSGDGPARFVPLPCPRDGELLALLLKIVRKTEKALGRLDVDDGDAEEDRRIRFPDLFKNGRHSAFLDGFSLHAGVRIHEHDRDGRERLFRYAARPPFAHHRLSAGPEGRLVYRMKRPRGGSLFLLLTPDELLSRIATLVPPPRTHALRYHGLFAPHSKHRARVVPVKAAKAAVELRPGDALARDEKPCAGPAVPGPGPFRLTSPDASSAVTPLGDDHPRPRYRVPWAELLRKVFAVDVLACPVCQGQLEVIAFIAEPTVARRILDHLGLASQAPPIERAREPDELPDGDQAPDCGAADPIYEE